jgi:hypothetical protein
LPGRGNNAIADCNSDSHSILLLFCRLSEAWQSCKMLLWALLVSFSKSVFVSAAGNYYIDSSQKSCFYNNKIYAPDATYKILRGFFYL